jgi:hypothetical protein
MRTLRLSLILVLFAGLSITEVSAQQRAMYEVHSMMVYNFMKYVHWPPTATSGDFVIGVIGDKNVYNTLTQWYGTKSKGAQKIIIKQFKSVAELTDCHVLYVARSKSGSFGDLKVALKGKPTLLITDKMGMGKKGSGINFKTVESKLKFELNQEAIASANLKVASQLTGMAIIL